MLTSGRPFYRHLIILTLVLLCFCPVSFVLSCVGIFITPIAQAINESPATLSYYFSILSVAGFVSLPFLGPLFQKVDSRIILSCSVIAIALALFLQSIITATWQFFACGVLAGLGMTPLLYLAPSVLINRWFIKRNGFFIGLVMAFTGIGGVVWNAIGGALIQGVGYQLTYVVFAVITLVVTLPFTLFIIRDRPEDKGLLPYGAEDGEAGARSVELSGMTSKQAFKAPSFLLLLIYAFLLNLGMYAYSMFPSFLATVPEAAAYPMLGAMVSSATMAAQTGGKLIWGAIGGKNPVISIVVGCVLGIVGVIVVASFASQFALLFVGAVLFGFYYAITNVMNPIVTQQFFGDRDYSVIYSRVTTAATLGMVAGSLAWGTLINIVGNYSPMFIGTATSLALAAVSIFIAGRVQKRIKSQDQLNLSEQI